MVAAESLGPGWYLLVCFFGGVWISASDWQPVWDKDVRAVSLVCTFAVVFLQPDHGIGYEFVVG